MMARERAMDSEPRHRGNVPAARLLRRQMTPSEQMLWRRLRDRKLDGWKLRRQHAIGAFVLDFYCDELKLAIEVDGGIHNISGRIERDRSRQEILAGLGLRFIRVQSEEVERDVEAVIEQLRALLPHPPAPSPARREKGSARTSLPREMGEGRGEG